MAKGPCYITISILSIFSSNIVEWSSTLVDGNVHLWSYEFKLAIQFSAQAPAEVTLSQEQLDDIWDDVSGELSAIFQGRGEPLPEAMSPFDAASEVDVDQQR